MPTPTPTEQISLVAIFESINPLLALILAGLLGGCTALLYEAYNGYFSRKSLIHIGFGIIGALLAGLINTIPGTAGIFFTGLITGIGGVTLIGQYIEKSETADAITSSVNEHKNTIQQLERYNTMMIQIEQALNTQKPPQEVITEISRVVRTVQNRPL